MKKVTGFIAALALATSINAQEYKFETIADLDATEIKSQGKTGTCWSFSTTSFIESEILRLTGKSVDLSEMFNARVVYSSKAKNFVSRQGKAQFSEGGLNHDAMKVIRDFGLITEEAYSAKKVDQNAYDHRELSAILENYAKTVVMQKTEPSKIWLKGYDAVLDTYLGSVPQKFTFEGKEYTPAGFRDAMKIDPDNYVQFTSFAEFNDYEKVIVNIPDNWANGSYYNLPLEEYYQLVVSALKDGYTVAIDADVSEKTFSAKHGLAIVPEFDNSAMTAAPPAELFKEIVSEKEITASIRQEEFNNYNTTDDHLMHITGLLKDQNGTLYFRVKNSWGTEGRGNGGNVYFSEAYFKLKSISVMMHKDAVSKELKKKLGIK